MISDLLLKFTSLTLAKGAHAINVCVALKYVNGQKQKPLHMRERRDSKLRKKRHEYKTTRKGMGARWAELRGWGKGPVNLVNPLIL